MSFKSPKGVINALLDEYQVVISDLKNNIADIKDSDLEKIIDQKTLNKDCVSIQSLLTHIIHCGSFYITMIDIHRGNTGSIWPVRKKLNSVSEYNFALDEMMNHTNKFFENIPQSEMSQYDPSKKILTFWGQLYDIEQLMEHAIVHISRHRRQIQKFKSELKKVKNLN
ncbi:MAG TPA: DinB family protein [Ignavibacteria bacterium]|nr:DinB family protein [Ignavibacteria bacterium]